MLVKEGFQKLKLLEGKKISDVNLINKGSDGQKIMTAIGLTNDSRALDFEDGDLKTNKILNGKPAETLWISQIQKNLAMFDKGLTFYDSWIYNKIKQFIYLPIDKTDEHIIGKPKIISAQLYPDLYAKLAVDFNFISKEIKNCIDLKTELHTINGPNNYLQIRTKAGKIKGRYIPMVYKNHQLKDKYMAFYFRKDFLFTIFKS